MTNAAKSAVSAARLGDYIHFKESNYQRWGLSYPDPNYSDIVTKKDFVYPFLQEQRNIKQRIYQYNSGLSKIEKDQMGSALQKIFPGKHAITDPEVFQKQVWQTLTDALDQEFSKGIGVIDYSTGDIKAINKVGVKLDKIQSANRHKKDTIAGRIQTLMSLINELGTSLSTASKITLQTRINNVNNAFNDIVTQAIEENPKKYKVNQNWMLSKAQSDNIVNEINSIIADLGSATINQQKGVLFEQALSLVPAIIQQKGESLTNQALKDMIAKNWTAKKTSKVRLVGDFISDKIKFDELNFKGYNLEDGYYVSSLASTEKIDVTLERDEQSPLYISAKNVNLFNPRGVNIVSDTSFLYLMQDENMILINNYLNTSRSQSKLGKAQENALNCIKLICLIKAATGDTYGRNNKANLFIINNNKTGEFQIWDMKDLLEVCVSYLDTTTTFKGLDEVYFADEPWIGDKQPNADDAYRRIAEIIRKMQATKISISIKPVVFGTAKAKTGNQYLF